VWADAYLEQARSDWQVWELIRNHELPPCHALHYLQMTGEKLGKAFLLTGGALSLEQARNSHVAFKRFLQFASRHPELQRLLEMNSAQFRAHIKNMLPLADAIERLAPALAQDGPNVEYPWQSHDRKIHTPAKHDFSVLRQLLEPSGLNLIKIVDLVLRKFYRLFV
jgi:hypothetical protein